MIQIKSSDTVIHVNRGQIDSNRIALKSDPSAETKPVLKAQKGKTGKSDYGNAIDVLDAHGEVVGTFVYDPAGILACGAKAVFIAKYGARVRHD
ncbi:hypothetical protein HOU00_gp319 [Caulobacter phage CcrPW]|uniref:Uncharacterized protein n=1 Tax=Caulobacter phage CcrPW TaxID=2283271 RepID=A0A385EAP5_9CAUD|nr:hypothetical protein HOU00_gp319 [Caulobacter phage CcrPW]AXQ68806.1 hypothetical protein CcrPW_gp267 [Caulobacter phage CcrPW]